MSKIKIAFFVFLIVSILDIIGVIFKIPQLVFIFKPLIILSLLVLYVVSTALINKRYVVALIFSFFGDVFLIFEGHFYFISGLISFLIAHFLFISIVVKRLNKTSILKVGLTSMPFFILFFVLLFFLKESLHNMLLPVIIYGLTLSAFVVVSFLDYSSKKSLKTFYMLSGAVIFMMSDSILAINKFYYKTDLSEIIIMITYIIAQYLIYKSMIQKKENKV